MLVRHIPVLLQWPAAPVGHGAMLVSEARGDWPMHASRLSQGELTLVPQKGDQNRLQGHHSAHMAGPTGSDLRQVACKTPRASFTAKPPLTAPRNSCHATGVCGAETRPTPRSAHWACGSRLQTRQLRNSNGVVHHRAYYTGASTRAVVQAPTHMVLYI